MDLHLHSEQEQKIQEDVAIKRRKKEVDQAHSRLVQFNRKKKRRSESKNILASSRPLFVTSENSDVILLGWRVAMGVEEEEEEEEAEEQVGEEVVEDHHHHHHHHQMKTKRDQMQ